MRFRCPTCPITDVQELEEFTEHAAGVVNRANGWSSPAWWIPAAPWHVVQGEIVFVLRHRDGLCHRHAALFGALAVDHMRRRCYGATFPGQVSVVTGDLAEPPYDEIGGLDEAEEITRHVRERVAGSKVGAVVSVDRGRARMRCTFVLVDAAGVVEAAVPASRLRRWPEGASIERALRL